MVSSGNLSCGFWLVWPSLGLNRFRLGAFEIFRHREFEIAFEEPNFAKGEVGAYRAQSLIKA